MFGLDFGPYLRGEIARLHLVDPYQVEVTVAFHRQFDPLLFPNVFERRLFRGESRAGADGVVPGRRFRVAGTDGRFGADQQHFGPAHHSDVAAVVFVTPYDRPRLVAFAAEAVRVAVADRVRVAFAVGADDCRAVDHALGLYHAAVYGRFAIDDVVVFAFVARFVRLYEVQRRRDVSPTPVRFAAGAEQLPALVCSVGGREAGRPDFEYRFDAVFARFRKDVIDGDQVVSVGRRFHVFDYLYDLLIILHGVGRIVGGAVQQHFGQQSLSRALVGAAVPRGRIPFGGFGFVGHFQRDLQIGYDGVVQRRAVGNFQSGLFGAGERFERNDRAFTP